MQYLGDINLNDTIYLSFSTNDGSGLPVTFTGDVSGIYVNKEATNALRSSWNGMVLNKNTNGILGCHLLSIDTSDNTDAGFYAINNDYGIVCSGFVIDSIAVNSALGSFSIENRNDYADLRKIKGESGPANNLYASASTIQIGYVGDGATTTVFKADNITEGTADHYNGRIVIFTSGDLKYQATDITDYENSGGYGQFTVTALTEAPVSGTPFVIV